jgi:hypothetical protein
VAEEAGPGGEVGGDVRREMADGFHYASWFVRDWTSHPNFPRPEPEQYYNDCIQRIGDLADWFFRGWHVYTRTYRHCPDVDVAAAGTQSGGSCGCGLR